MRTSSGNKNQRLPHCGWWEAVTLAAPGLEYPLPPCPTPSLCTLAVCLGKCLPLSESGLAHLQSGAVLAASEGG